jgi:hypothetical protein
MTADKEISDAWRTVAGTPAGRLAIAELMMSLNLYSEINATNEMQAGIAIGERNIAARIARWIGRKESEFVQEAVEDVDLLERMMKTRSGDNYA